ncbi:MAG: energy-coupling factor transporter transmembrane protein EcfT [candidate division KSB1 bacterium]|nr:energy-coupling factor transporter transmembrane protein EcfT [candidate division KSB1 bacterium]MDZ7303151.1 energy-coupling factor transporter transmembrane protein EcfT [candidate division KSB1 bacterium]MDZ7310131.1 energy-coupling factor transporter transmembrane protein EcfT [candidate division KSB1 bacterium]
MAKSRRRPSISHRLTLGQYLPGASSLHQLDPRTKLLLSMVVMSLLMWIESWPALIFWMSALAVVAMRTQLPARLFLRNLRAFLWLFALTILLHALSPGYSAAQSLNGFGMGPQLRVWGISISWTGWLVGLKYALRLALLIVVTGILSFTTVPTDLTDGLERLLRPMQKWRVPVHELAFMTTLALRFVPTIVEEAERIQRAQLSRGAKFSGSLVARVQSLVPLIVPLVVATFHRADDLAIAMEARCYRGSAGRNSFREMRFARRDFWAIGAVIFCAAITIIYERMNAA